LKVNQTNSEIGENTHTTNKITNKAPSDLNGGPTGVYGTTAAAPGCQRLVRLKRVCNCKCIDVLKIQVHDSIFVLDQIRTNRLPSRQGFSLIAMLASAFFLLVLSSSLSSSSFEEVSLSQVTTYEPPFFFSKVILSFFSFFSILSFFLFFLSSYLSLLYGH